MSSRIIAFLPLTLALTLHAHPPTNSSPIHSAQPNPLPSPALSATETNTVFKKSAGYPFRGKLAGVDFARSTIQIGKSTYWITAQTKITKLGRPARLNDGVIGEEAVGYARKAADGRAVAASLRFGPKVEAAPVLQPAVIGSSKKG